MNAKARIESLEPRIAPATLAGQVLTYTDIDGDKVAITISQGTLTAGMFSFDNGSVDGDNSLKQQLRLIDLSDTTGVGGANIKMKVTKAGTGDGLAAIGRINGGTNNLGAVTIKGDLAEIDCGSNAADTPALKALTVRSMGLYGLVTGGDNLRSDITGELGKLVVAGDLHGAYVRVGGGKDIGSVFVGGSVVGGAGTDSGEIYAQGNLGRVMVKGDVLGGNGQYSGSIGAGKNVGNVTIGGSLLGSFGPNSGWIYSGFLFLPDARDMGVVKIGHNVQGGSGINSGFIECRGQLGPVTIGGSLIGGEEGNTGQVYSGLNMGAVRIGHDLIGGTDDGITRVVVAGLINCGGDLTSVTVGGSLIGRSAEAGGKILAFGKMGAVKIRHDVVAGTDQTTGEIDGRSTIASVTIGGSLIGGPDASGVIFADSDLGPVRIGHDVRGGMGDESGEIKAGGKLTSISIGGSLNGGAGLNSGRVFCGGDMGTVTLGGSLIGGSNTDCGKIRSAGDMGAVKIGHDVKGGGGDQSGMISAGETLTSVSIRGSLIGGVGNYTSVSAAFVAQVRANHIGPVKIGHDVIGGGGQNSGSIAAGNSIGGTIASVTIGGSLIGGSATGAGTLISKLNMGPVAIGQNLIGGSIAGSHVDVFDSGAIRSFTRIASVSIGGSVLAGTDDSDSGALFTNATIQAQEIGPIAVKGSVVGTVGNGGDITRVVFSTSLPASSETLSGAIDKITIGGRAERLNIFAGSGSNSKNGDAQIGAVSVGGDWIASSIAAGVENWGGNDVDENGDGDDNIRFGDSHDHLIDSSALLGKIARITIKGIVIGTEGMFTDHFGFVSHTIGSLKINGSAIPIAASVPLSPLTGDVTLHLI